MTDQTTTNVTILGIGQMGLVCANMLAGVDPGLGGQRKAGRVSAWGHDVDEGGALTQTLARIHF